jgi:hypothetical protein
MAIKHEWRLAHSDPDTTEAAVTLPPPAKAQTT